VTRPSHLLGKSCGAISDGSLGASWSFFNEVM
jgi:hypothetical protein